MITLKNDLTIVSLHASAPGAVRLQQAALNLGYDAKIQIIGSDDVVSMLNDSKAVIFRIGPKSYDLYKVLQSQVNPNIAKQVSNTLQAFDKAATHQILQSNDIATANSEILLRSDMPKSFPIVAKILHGNQGNGVELINSPNEYTTFVNKYPNDDLFLVQEFIAEANSKDKRLIIVNGMLVAAMERKGADGDFRANIHTGGAATAFNPTEQEILLAIRATAAFELPYAGVDIIDSARGPLVLEVNPSPGLAISDITGINVATKIVEGVMKRD